MNYILQLNAFWNWVRTNEISHLEADLYLTLLDIANASLWKTRFSVPNSTLGRFDKNALTRARNKLVQCGLIYYEKGKKGQAPMYGIVNLYEMIPDLRNYTDTNIGNYIDTNMQPKQGTYINKNKTKQNKPPIPPLENPFTGALSDKVEEWLAYKKERGQGYKPTGKKALFQKIGDAAKAYGETAVMHAIDASISNNWQGLFFERLAASQNAPPVFGDALAHDELEQLARKRWAADRRG